MLDLCFRKAKIVNVVRFCLIINYQYIGFGKVFIKSLNCSIVISFLSNLLKKTSDLQSNSGQLKDDSWEEIIKLYDVRKRARCSELLRLSGINLLIKVVCPSSYSFSVIFLLINRDILTNPYSSEEYPFSFCHFFIFSFVFAGYKPVGRSKSVSMYTYCP